MGMFVVMAIVIVLTLGVMGTLFYFMKKEAEKGGDGQAVLITDISELKQKADEKLAEAPSESVSGSEDELSEAKAKLVALEREQSVAPSTEPTELSDGFTPESVERKETNEIKFSKIIGEETFSGSSDEEFRLRQKIAELEAQLKLISDKAVRQAEESVKVIEALLKENEEIKAKQVMSSMDLSGDVSRSIVELKERNSILENQLDLSSAKISQLETQLVIIKKEMGQQLIEANAAIARLKAESEAEDRIGRESLLKEKTELEEWREKTSRQLRDMEDTVAQAKEENLLLKDAKKLLEAKIAVFEDDAKRELGQAKEIVSTLTEQKEEQASRIVELEQNLDKLKELNSTLIDKAKILQYELNRHRAQASGLERVCQNFKTQMEGLFGQVEQTKNDNNRLVQERSSLQEGFASLRNENSKLLERDRMYQSELEKTKEQISRFEKIYNNFKSGVDDKGKA